MAVRGLLIEFVVRRHSVRLCAGFRRGPIRQDMDLFLFCNSASELIKRAGAQVTPESFVLSAT